MTVKLEVHGVMEMPDDWTVTRATEFMQTYTHYFGGTWGGAVTISPTEEQEMERYVQLKEDIASMLFDFGNRTFGEEESHTVAQMILDHLESKGLPVNG